MAYSNEFLQIPGLVAGGDLSSSQYKVVKMASTAGAVVAVNATTDAGFGVLLNDPTEGQEAQVAVLGVVKGLFGDSIDAGAFIGFDSTGRVQARTSDNGQTIGFAPFDSTVSDLQTIIIYGQGRR